MKQVIAIHGGTTFARYEDFLKSLSTKKLIVERFTYKPIWKELLQENLGPEYQVLLPSMPNKQNAKYSEWKIWFDHFSEIAEDDCIIIGHSMGAIFLAKYLSENKFPRKIKATIMIAGPYDDETGEDLTDFKLEGISELFKSQAGRTVFFFGHDDVVTPESEIKKYQADLPSAEFNIMSAPDHFMRVEFPELLNTIKQL